MKPVRTINFKVWPLWVQVLVVLVAACLLVGTVSSRLIRHLETDYLYELQQLHTKKTFQTIISGTIESIITEDRPVLNTFINEFVAIDKSIQYLSIQNEDSDILAEWKNTESPPGEDSLNISENVDYEGEKFGSIRIIWDTQSLYEGINRHTLNTQLFVVLTTLFLSLVIMVWLMLAVVRPLSRLAHRLDPDNFSNPNLVPVSKYLPIEFKRLHDAIDRLREVSISRKELIQEMETRVSAEQAAESARDEAIRANNVKSAFLATISHELRTPLNAIIGYSDLLLAKKGSKDKKETREALSTIKTSGKYLLEIINSILDYSKIEAEKLQLNLEDIDLRELINNIKMISLPLMYQNNNKFKIILAEGIDLFQTDPIRLNQVLLNLLSNAAKFTKNGMVTLEVHKSKGHVTFSISDTGIGIDTDELDNLFMPFMQGDNFNTRRFEGTGLGLAITKRLVELLEGTIAVRSEKHAGTTFTLNFPYSKINRKSSSAG